MPSNDQYASMAGAAYASTCPVANQIPAPAGWYAVDQRIDDTSGFEAYTFGNSPSPEHSTEIVIAYPGTDQGDITGDWPANAGLATGTETGSDQRDTPMFGYGRQAIAIRRQDAAQRWHAATQSSMSPKAAH